MPLLRWLTLALVLTPCPAWDTAPHQAITRAALGALPPRLLDRFADQAAPLIEIYCIYPDRYLEMENYGFVRKSPGPRTAAEIKPYCVRPDGRPVHGISGDRRDDLVSLAFLFERIGANLSARRPAEAARYAGVLSHFIADSLSPPHAAAAEELQAMLEEAGGGIQIHSALEKSIPAFTLGSRPPRPANAQATLEGCYAGAARNRRDLPAMVRAACARDGRALDLYLRPAGVRAAEILAGALYSIAGAAENAR